MSKDAPRPAPLPARRDTLKKLGAELRWLLEKSGVDPERALVAISVKSTIEQSAIISTFIREFDHETMRRDSEANVVTVLGVPIVVVVEKPKSPLERA